MKKYCLLILFTCLLCITIYFICTDNSFLNDNNKSAYNDISNDSKVINGTNLNNLYIKNKSDNSTIQCSAKVHITIAEYIKNQQCTRHIIKDGETLTDIYKNYNSTCPSNAYLKLIKSINNLNSSNYIQPGNTLLIPEITLKNGKTHKIVTGDTWNKLCNEYYPVYDLNSIMNLLIYVNDYKNNTLPLGDTIFLPQI